MFTGHDRDAIQVSKPHCDSETIKECAKDVLRPAFTAVAKHSAIFGIDCVITSSPILRKVSQIPTFLSPS